MVTDPVCLRQLNEREVKDKSEYRGQTYYFHNDRCRDVFERDPEDFAGIATEVAYGDNTRFYQKKGE